MRIPTCGVCDKPIAASTRVCPHCGDRAGVNRARAGFLVIVLTMIALFMACHALVSPASAQGFYARTDLNGTLARCVDATAEWAGCTDAGGEPGIGLAFEAGYAPTSWLDLGLLLGAGRLSMTGGEDLANGYIVPLGRLNIPAMRGVSPFVEAGYGYGVTATCGTGRLDRAVCRLLAYDEKRNAGGVLLLGGGLRWHASEHWKPTLSMRRVDYTGDPRNECCSFDPGQGRRTNTWQLGVGVEFRP